MSDDFRMLALNQDVKRSPGERSLVCARVVTANPYELSYKNVMLTQQKTPVKNSLVLGDCLAAVTEDGGWWLECITPQTRG